MTDQLEFLFAIEVNNHLGEAVQWHAPSQTLWWTDIHDYGLYRFDWATQQLTHWLVPHRVTAFGILATDPVRLLVSFDSGFAIYQPDSEQLQWLARPELDQPANRFNDGRVDRQGRFWAGTMQDVGDRQPVGSLYRLDASGAQPQIANLTIPNTLCWSLDGRTAYHADTPTGLIQRYDFDADSGQLSNPQPFAKAPRGYPDGGLIDSEGYLLCALFAGSGVARFTPQGELVAVYDLPASQPTCVTLGGPDMDILFVSSATEAMSDEQKAVEPQAGNVLVYKTPFKGVLECTPAEQHLPKPMSN